VEERSGGAELWNTDLISYQGTRLDVTGKNILLMTEKLGHKSREHDVEDPSKSITKGKEIDPVGGITWRPEFHLGEIRMEYEPSHAPFGVAFIGG